MKLRRAGSMKAVILVSLLALVGCHGGTPVKVSTITDIAISGRVTVPDANCDEHGNKPICTAERAERHAFAHIGKEIRVFPAGNGRCDLATVDFGDGSAVESITNVPLDLTGASARHTYSGWPGLKRIRVKGVSGCVGDVTKDVQVGFPPDSHMSYVLAFAPNTSVCNAVPHVPPVRTGSALRITADGSKIVYGLISFDASGDRAGRTPADYPFPTMRQFSLVYRIGSLIKQAEVGPVVLVANQTAPLEICVNDHKDWLGDNRGAVRIDIVINETNAQ